MTDTLYADVSEWSASMTPFGQCDMNSADGLTAEEFARACGVVATDSAPSEVAA